MESIWISYKTKSSDLPKEPDFAFKLRVFRERVEGWQLKPAKAMEGIEWSGFARLAVLINYFEMVEQYASGKSSDRQSRDFFEKGFRRVYATTPLTPKQIGLLYGRLRCGLYHNGGAKRGLLIDAGFSEAVSFRPGDDTFCINPDRLLADVSGHFAQFVLSLETADEATKALFVKRFDEIE